METKNLAAPVILGAILLAASSANAQSYYTACYKTDSNIQHISGVTYHIGAGQFHTGQKGYTSGSITSEYVCTRHIKIEDGSDSWGDFVFQSPSIERGVRRKASKILPDGSRLKFLYDVQKLYVDGNGKYQGATVLYKEEYTAPRGRPVIINNDGKGEIIEVRIPDPKSSYKVCYTISQAALDNAKGIKLKAITGQGTVTMDKFTHDADKLVAGEEKCNSEPIIMNGPGVTWGDLSIYSTETGGLREMYTMTNRASRVDEGSKIKFKYNVNYIQKYTDGNLHTASGLYEEIINDVVRYSNPFTITCYGNCWLN